jgi:hypothetical protein
MAEVPADPAAPRRSRVRWLLEHLVLAAVFAAGTALSWQRWTDPLVDFGRQLYVPWRLLEGDVLYRDVAHVFGPLAAYLNAVVMAVAGVSLRSLAYAGLVTAFACACLLRALFARLGGSAAGMLAAVLFLLLFAFPQYVFQANFNFVTPYSTDLTYGIVLALLCLHALPGTRAEAGRGPLRALVAGACLGLVALGKPEVLLALLCALGVSVALRSREAGLGRALPWLPFLGAAAAVPLLAAVLFASALLPADALRAAFGGILPALQTDIAATPYYAWVAGTDAPALNLSRMFFHAYPYALALLAGAWLDRRTALRAPVFAGAALALLVVLPLLAVRALDTVWVVQQAVRPLPLLVAVALAALGLRCLRATDARERRLLDGWIVTGVFALALLAKIALAARFFHYGFALAMPAAVWLAALLARPPPALLPAGRPMRWTRLLPGALCAAVAAAHLQVSLAHYAKRTLVIGEGADAMTVFAPPIDARGPDVQAFLGWARANLPPGARLLVLPDGAMLDFQLRREAGVPFYTLTQPELQAYGEARVLAAYRAAPPEFVALLEQSNRLFGRLGEPGFGPRIVQWIEQDYVPCAEFGLEGGDGAGIRLLGRAGHACPAAR